MGEILKVELAGEKKQVDIYNKILVANSKPAITVPSDANNIIGIASRHIQTDILTELENFSGGKSPDKDLSDLEDIRKELVNLLGVASNTSLEDCLNNTNFGNVLTTDLAVKIFRSTYLVSNKTVIEAIVNNKTVMETIVNSKIAMEAIANSKIAMEAIVSNKTVIEAIVNSKIAIEAIANSKLATKIIAKDKNGWTTINTPCVVLAFIRGGINDMKINGSTYNKDIPNAIETLREKAFLQKEDKLEIERYSNKSSTITVIPLD